MEPAGTIGANGTGFQCPTLVVRAGNGFFHAEILRDMAQRLPKARFVDIPGAAHDLHLDRPAEWQGAVAEFLATLRPVSIGS